MLHTDANGGFGQAVTRQMSGDERSLKAGSGGAGWQRQSCAALQKCVEAGQASNCDERVVGMRAASLSGRGLRAVRLGQGFACFAASRRG